MTTFLEWVAKLPRVVGVSTPKGYRWDCPHCGKSHLRIVHTLNGKPVTPDLARCKARQNMQRRWVRVVQVLERSKDEE